MNLSPARLAVLVALVVGGLAVMINGFGDDAGVLAGGATVSSAPSPSESPIPSGAASPTASQSAAPTLEPQVEGVVIQVLNGTNETGLATQVDQLLVGKGYEQGLAPGDVATKPVTTTTVYFRTGDEEEQNEVDAENLATRFLKGVQARVQPLNATLDADVAPPTQLVVVLGDDYAEAHPVV